MTSRVKLLHTRSGNLRVTLAVLHKTTCRQNVGCNAAPTTNDLVTFTHDATTDDFRAIATRRHAY